MENLANNSVRTFHLYGSTEAIAVDGKGGVSLIDRPSLEEALLMKYPDATIIDRRVSPDLDLINRLSSHENTNQAVLVDEDDFSPS